MTSSHHLSIVILLFAFPSAFAAEQRGAAPAMPTALPATSLPAVQALPTPVTPRQFMPGSAPIAAPGPAAAKSTPLPPALPRNLKCSVSQEAVSTGFGGFLMRVVVTVTNDLGGRETIPAGSVIAWSYKTASGKTGLGATLLPGQSAPLHTLPVQSVGYNFLQPAANTCNAKLLP